MQAHLYRCSDNETIRGSGVKCAWEEAGANGNLGCQGRDLSILTAEDALQPGFNRLGELQSVAPYKGTDLPCGRVTVPSMQPRNGPIGCSTGTSLAYGLPRLVITSAFRLLS